MERQGCKVLLHVPFHRLFPRAFTSWFAQADDGVSVDVLIQRYDPKPDTDTYGNLEIKNELARKLALVGDYDYLFNVEHDIVLPDNALQLLLWQNSPVISGLYRLRPEHSGGPHLAARVYDPGGPQDGDDRYLERGDFIEYGDIVECTLVCLGCLLIKRSILEGLAGVMGNDVEISRWLHTIDVKPLVHTGVKCGHITSSGDVLEVGNE